MQIVKQKHVGWIGVRIGNECINGTTRFVIQPSNLQIIPVNATPKEINMLIRSMREHHTDIDLTSIIRFLKEKAGYL